MLLLITLSKCDGLEMDEKTIFVGFFIIDSMFTKENILVITVVCIFVIEFLYQDCTYYMHLIQLTCYEHLSLKLTWTCIFFYILYTITVYIIIIMLISYDHSGN